MIFLPFESDCPSSLIQYILNFDIEKDNPISIKEEEATKTLRLIIIGKSKDILCNRFLNFRNKLRLAIMESKIQSKALIGTIKVINDNLDIPVILFNEYTDPALLMVSFSGQGTQFNEMGLEQSIAFPQYKDNMHLNEQLLDEVITQHPEIYKRYNLDSIQRIFSTTILQKASIDSTLKSQILILFNQMAWYDWFRNHGLIQPLYYIGYSSGEMGAGYALGRDRLSPILIRALQRDIILSAFHRGLSCSVIDGEEGTMAVVKNRSSMDVEKLVNQHEKLYLAASNTEDIFSISGSLASIDKVVSSDPDIRKIRVDQPYHSPLMKSVSSFYLKLQRAQQVFKWLPKTIDISYYATSQRAQLLTNLHELLNESYFPRSLSHQIAFRQSMECILKHFSDEYPNRILINLDIGCHPAVNGCIDEIDNKVITLSTTHGKHPSALFTSHTIATLFVNGLIPFDASLFTAHGIHS